MKTKEQKLEEVRRVAAELTTKATQAGVSGPFATVALDLTYFTIFVDAPGPTDSTLAPPLAWEKSEKVTVMVFGHRNGLVPTTQAITF